MTTELKSKPCGAWYGEPKLKAAVMTRLREDRKLDRIVQGSYWSAGENRGCHLGCLTRQPRDTHKHAERWFNLPLKVGHWLEAVFEGLHESKCEWWVIEGTDAIAAGADLSLAHHHLGVWLLGDDSPSAEGNRHPLVRDAIANVRALLVRAANGEDISSAARAADSAASARSSKATVAGNVWSIASRIWSGLSAAVWSRFKNKERTMSDKTPDQIIPELLDRLRKINEIVDHFERPFVSISPEGQAEIHKLCDVSTIVSH